MILFLHLTSYFFFFLQNGPIFILGGNYVGVGARSNQVFQSVGGIYCDIGGVPCSYRFDF